MKWRLLLICLLILTEIKAQHLIILLENTVKGESLSLRNTNYLNAAGDTFNITSFKYYLSNFYLTDSSGKTVKLSSECFLVSEDSSESKKITLNMPKGEFKSISFMIGVDSLLNCTGAQGGALDPVYGMFWTWNSGYIMVKLEGTSPSSHLPGHMIEFHIGGYRAPHITQRWVTLPLSGMVTTRPPIQYQYTQAFISIIRVSADIYTLLNGISFHQLAGFMTPGSAADRIADNYQHMFSVKN
jgi:hypothetical protein